MRLKTASNNVLILTAQRPDDFGFPQRVGVKQAYHGGYHCKVRLLKQVVNEAAGVAFSPAQPELSEQLFSRVGYVEDFSSRERSWVFFGDSRGCSKFPPARPQGAGRLRRTLAVRRKEARD